MKICTGVDLGDVIMDVKFKFEKNISELQFRENEVTQILANQCFQTLS